MDARGNFEDIGCSLWLFEWHTSNIAKFSEKSSNHNRYSFSYHVRRYKLLRRELFIRRVFGSKSRWTHNQFYATYSTVLRKVAMRKIFLVAVFFVSLLFAGPKWQKSGNGRCFTTGGNGSSYVSIPNTLLRGRSNVTISMWVYIQSGQGTLPIIGWQYPGGDMPPLGVFYTGSGGHADNGDGSGAMPYNSFHINLGNSGGQEIVNFTYAQPPAGWHFFTMSTNSSGTLKLYMDGGNIGVWSAPTWRYFSTNYTYPIYLGMHPYTPAPIYTQTSIDEMRVYNYEMTGAEVLSLYQSYIQ